MSRYIDADNYKKDLIQLGFLRALVVSVLDKQPTADVVEVRHGEWIDTGDRELDTIYSGYKCSECGFIICGHSGKYCSECGAKMDGERKEL